MKRIHVMAAGAIAISMMGLASYFSPQWDLYQMSSAIKNHDADAFSKKVDFPSLRESLKAQMMLAMDNQMSSAGMGGNPFAGLGQMMAGALLNPVIDAAVSPAGVMHMFRNGSAKPVQPVDQDSSDSPREVKARDYSVAYRNWDTVSVTKEGQKSGAFIFKRAGLWSWKLAAIELPTTPATR
jgi:hypothetical protein